MDNPTSNGTPPEGPQRCNATAKSTGKQCGRPVVPPTSKCRYHGGKSLRGIAHPRYTNGMHSKYLPTHLKADYKRAMEDAELLSLNSQLALLTTRELELTKQLGDTELPPWGQAVDALVDLEKAMTSGDRPSMNLSFKSLADTVRQGADHAKSYAEVWGELREVILEKTKVASAENKRLEQMNGFVKLNDLMMILFGMLDAVRTHVIDLLTAAQRT
jgi:hypothetical protein